MSNENTGSDPQGPDYGKSEGEPVPPPPPTPPTTPPPPPQASYAPPPQQPPPYGQPVVAGQPYYGNAQPKSKLVAGILGILLGGFGVHRFYLGYTTIGIIQIIVTIFTCGIGAIWGLIEGIMILVGASGFTTDANGVPLSDN